MPSGLDGAILKNREVQFPSRHLANVRPAITTMNDRVFKHTEAHKLSKIRND